ncbi:MAG: glycosylase [Candidatus Kerfeldbacteria bacterium CG_4_10_14_0_8_um_filter_42_10]|uniref:Glycosylase n=1 Tax=Candidatus Kerfeldbacteria bacterium CG_4_10_14_0_8_um_filter_42_10 TaxID=2014248 RepID=A0A2M7RKP1_9BACT|nr:MAG: glycosylase [Candidatus Kerfeldbacteria bacterium CG_4_10_14_0_8_um_filter_42_10]
MFKWKKLGRIFNPLEIRDIEWMKEFAQAPSVLIFDKFIRVYFSCRPLPDENGQYVSYAGYVDLNRSNLSEIVNISKNPVLKLGEPGTFDEFGTYPTSVIKNGNDILAYYGGWTRCESVPFNVAIGLAVSQDNGTTFNKVGPGPILSYSPEEPFVLSGPKIRKFNDLWYLYYISGRKWIMADGRAEPVYKIRMATSSDGKNWIKINKDLIDSKVEEDEAQASPDVFFYQERYHMFFCYRYSTSFRSKEKGYRIGYAYSKDLINWIRDDTKVGMDVSEEGWDSEMLAYPHVFEIDNSIYMLYLGNQVGRHGFGLAKLESYKP